MRRASTGMIVAILGIAGTFVAYPAGAKPGSRHYGKELAAALKKCKKDKPQSKRKKCERTAKAEYKLKTETGGHKGTGTGTETGTGTGTGTGTTGATGTANTTGTTGTTVGGGPPPGTFCPQASLVVHVITHNALTVEGYRISYRGVSICNGEVPTAGEGEPSLPGRYEVTVVRGYDGAVLTSTMVTLSPNQKLEVTLEVPEL